MAELRPYPFGALISWMFRELDERQSIFELPARKFYAGDPNADLSVQFHGERAPTPLGPAAGPHTQMAQNIVLAWLSGCRVMELKTVQVMDQLEIPRPCIDMATVGFNVEWSQELRLAESLDEYVKASMLIEILIESGKVPLVAGFEPVIFDMSVGYDLAGIKTPGVQAFMHGMLDASERVEALRAQIPEAHAQYRALPFRTRLSDSLTLSTFHGCPPEEIEQICEHLMRDIGLNTIVKLNPTLLGPVELRRLLHDVMGYTELDVPAQAFEEDTKWDQAVAFVERLGETASSVGLSFGVKFSNTLIVENHRDFFPAEEKRMYCSGAPLHVLAMNLVARFRARFGDRYPISFSAGIDKSNFSDAVAMGLVPVTTCSDLLKAGGYGRAGAYLKNLSKFMAQVGATDIETWIIKAYGRGEQALAALDLAGDDARRTACLEALGSNGDLRSAAGALFDSWVSAARLINTELYVRRCTEDPRYGKGKNNKPPRKIGSELVLFDCLTCDKCIPVCPNAANFAFDLPKQTLQIETLKYDGTAWQRQPATPLVVAKKHQLATFADFCNECGNCDVFCPEDGGPYAVKPLFFGSESDWAEFTHRDGFFIEGQRIVGRFGGAAYSACFGPESSTYTTPEHTATVDGALIRVEGDAAAGAIVDLTYFHILRWLHDSISNQLNAVSARE